MEPAAWVAHGTLDYAELERLGLSPDQVRVFSSNINPYGPSPAVIAAVQAAANGATIARYPDRLSLALSRALAAHHGVRPECVLVGNGTADLLWLVGLLFARQRRVAVLAPTFGEYQNVAALMQAEVSAVCHPGWVTAPAGFAPDATTVADSAAALAAAAPDLVFLCNPNNPTGRYLSPEDLRTLHDVAPAALWVVDEAYAEFTGQPWSAAPWAEQGGWLVLRSMTKDCALGGLRLGYAVGSPAMIQALRRAQPPWNVNLFAQIAGLAAMDSLAWRDQTLGKLRAHAREFYAALRSQGYHPLPTATNYVLVPVENATSARQALLSERLMVRDCTSFGLPQFIRIAVQLPRDNETLLAVMVRLVSPG